VFERLRRYVAGGATAVVVTHDLNLALRFADELWVVDHGALVQRGSPGEVLASQVMERVFAVRWHVGVVDDLPFVVPL
jgi:iron complex transport system ATP-binding protein